MKKLSIAVLAVAAAVAITPVAQAGTVSYSDTVSSFNVLTPETLSVQQFNMAGETLNSVTVTLTGDDSSVFYETFSGNNPTSSPSGDKAKIKSFTPDSNLYASGTSLDLELSGTDTVAANTYVYGAGSYTSSAFAIPSSSVSTTVGPAGYVGAGSVTFNITGDQNTAYTNILYNGESNTHSSTTTTADATITVTYDYSPTPTNVTPEPSSMFLLGTGLLALAGLVFGKKNGFSLNM
jgi:hypothetical protein